ncbi:MAG: hypothetical protein ABIQ44_08295 [Chloroflexia bacterium]
MPKQSGPLFPLHIARALQEADKAVSGAEKHTAALMLADAITCYVGTVGVAQYSQALLTEQIEGNPTLNRSLRSLRRVMTGQWLGWAAMSLEAVPGGPVEGMGQWYLHGHFDYVGPAYEELLRIMKLHLAYTGDYRSRQFVPPRILLELVDQYIIRRKKMLPNVLIEDLDAQVANSLLPGLKAILDMAGFLSEYPLYAPEARQLLMGPKPVTPMPPMSVPVDLLGAATLLLFKPGAVPDYTKRPTLEDARQPLFPLDPLMVYIQCRECNRHRLAALNEVVNGTPTYRGLDPQCRHEIIFTQKEN